MRHTHIQQRRKRQPSLTSAPLQLFAEQAQREDTASRTPGNHAHVASETWSFAQIPVTHAQSVGSASSEPVQRRERPVDRSTAPAPEQSMYHENRTGLPDRVKTGVEHLSGFSLDGVRVHYNSPKPAQVNALAYAQGSEIHVGPGQEKHLGEEAWHIVQQKQGRVKPTMQIKGVGINDNEGLEKEADVMGAKAWKMPGKREILPLPQKTSFHISAASQHSEGHGSPAKLKTSSQAVVQRYQRQGDFNQPWTPAHDGLNRVTAGLPRSAASTIAAYDGMPSTTLVFATGHARGDLGETAFEAHINEQWQNLYMICDPRDANHFLGLLLRRDTPIRITVTVDPTLHQPNPSLGPVPHTIEATLTHEINVHAIHVLPWLRKLRGGAYTGGQICAEWQAATSPSASLNIDSGHETFGSGDNRSYNETARDVHANIALSTLQQEYRNDIHADMDTHAPQGRRPKYPI